MDRKYTPNYMQTMNGQHDARLSEKSLLALPSANATDSVIQSIMFNSPLFKELVETNPEYKGIYIGPPPK